MGSFKPALFILYDVAICSIKLYSLQLFEVSFLMSLRQVTCRSGFQVDYHGRRDEFIIWAEEEVLRKALPPPVQLPVSISLVLSSPSSPLFSPPTAKLFQDTDVFLNRGEDTLILGVLFSQPSNSSES